ncbi:dipeptide epimerase [Massilia cavernae]|uniref:Dipeptide epimerase n=1 Tax=Massilia cavernae TaxID=2320864 RepID=A0A418XRZ8_9BURK|nr:dipeptide epimerase [Massilia cavernae]RJG15292.1 dipeptide epimerase [Massilia cavernae]
MLHIEGSIASLRLKQPFSIAGYRFEQQEVLRVTARDGACHATGEATGVYYLGDTAQSMQRDLAAIDSACWRGIDRLTLQRMLPAGGLRNALDCALWQLEANRRQLPLHVLAKLPRTHALLTTMTVGVASPEDMALAASCYVGARAIKLKLDGSALDGERIRTVRRRCPQVRLLVDANQGWDMAHLESLLPAMLDCRVELIEQPLPVGADDDLRGYRCPIPVAADESFQQLSDLEEMTDKYQLVNIKLDKCGGLTEALQIAREAPRHGLGVMVGSMVGTSIAMAPAFVAGQGAWIVDLDAPLFLIGDAQPAAQYGNGEIDFPVLWKQRWPEATSGSA